MTPLTTYLVVSAGSLALFVAWGWSYLRAGHELRARLPRLEVAQRSLAIRRWVVATACGLWVPLTMLLCGMWILLDSDGRRSEGTFVLLVGSAVSLAVSGVSAAYSAQHLWRFRASAAMSASRVALEEEPVALHPALGALVAWMLMLAVGTLLAGLLLVSLGLDAQVFGLPLAVGYATGALLVYVWQASTVYRIHECRVSKVGVLRSPRDLSLGTGVRTEMRAGVLARALGYADIVLSADGHAPMRLRAVPEPESILRLLETLASSPNEQHQS